MELDTEEAAALVAVLREWDEDEEEACSKIDFRRAVQALGKAGGLSRVPARDEIDAYFESVSGGHHTLLHAAIVSSCTPKDDTPTDSRALCKPSPDVSELEAAAMQERARLSQRERATAAKREAVAAQCAGDSIRAVELLTEAIGIDTTVGIDEQQTGALYGQRAEVRLTLHEYAAAESDARRAVQRDKSAKNYLCCSRACAGAGRLLPALEALALLLLHDADGTAPHNVVGRELTALRAQLETNPDEAANEARLLSPHIDGLLRRATRRIERGARRKALLDYQAALLLAPDNSDATKGVETTQLAIELAAAADEELRRNPPPPPPPPVPKPTTGFGSPEFPYPPRNRNEREQCAKMLGLTPRAA